MKPIDGSFCELNKHLKIRQQKRIGITTNSIATFSEKNISC